SLCPRNENVRCGPLIRSPSSGTCDRFEFTNSFTAVRYHSSRSDGGNSASTRSRSSRGSKRVLRSRRRRKASGDSMPDALAPAAAASRFVEGLVTAAGLGKAGRPMLEVAVALAEAGWPVFPCRPDTKQPLVPHGFKDRTKDGQQIKRWWGNSWRQATVGIVPADGGLVALDVDSPEALAALDAAGLLPSGFLDALKARAPD